MENDENYYFNIRFSCDAEYKLVLKGTENIGEILTRLEKELRITIPRDCAIYYSKLNILQYQTELIKDLQFFTPNSNYENELFINIPLKGILAYVETDDMFYDYKDDDNISFIIKVEKKSAKTKNLINKPYSKPKPIIANAAAAAITKNTSNDLSGTTTASAAATTVHNLVDSFNDLSLNDELVEEIYFHPDKITKLSVKTANVTQHMLEEKKIIIPVMAELAVGEFPKSPRASIDLVCVIDKSGSMSGEPIESVKKSLETILGLLGEKDRLCLITFDSVSKRISNLIKISKENKNELINIINSSELEPGSETNIGSGLQQALETLAQRRIINNISSIFLLSDGMDNSFTEKNCNKLLDKIERIIKSEKMKHFCYTLNTFGFGQSHDADLLSKLSLLKNGNFYFVNDYSTLPQLFKDCLDFMQKVICKKVIITIKPSKNARIIKVHGEENWKINSQGFYYTEIDALSYNRNLNFVFEVEVTDMSKASLDSLKQNGLMLAKIEGKLIGLNEYGNPTSAIEAESITFLERDKVKLQINPDIIVHFERFNLVNLLNKHFLKANQEINIETNLQLIENYIKNLEELSKHSQFINDLPVLQTLKSLMIEANKILEIFSNYEKYRSVARPLFKESYLNLLNQRNNFNTNVNLCHSEGGNRLGKHKRK